MMFGEIAKELGRFFQMSCTSESFVTNLIAVVLLFNFTYGILLLPEFLRYGIDNLISVKEVRNVIFQS